MRVLLDENIDSLLKELFDITFEILTVRDRGWNGMSNGALLQVAEAELDVFVTMDKNLEHQQNLQGLDLGIVVIRAYSNAFEVVAALIPKVNRAVRSVQPGQVVHIAA